MKVVAIIENSVASGGGFNQALNALVQFRDISRGELEFSVLTSRKENISILAELGIDAEIFKPSMMDKVVAFFATNEITRRIQARLRLMGPLERKMIRMGCDIAYFVTPSARPASLQYLNYITTVWDISHRDSPEFPEVRICGEFFRREFIYKNYLGPAYAILVDSEQLRERIFSRYGVDKDRMVVMPFMPNPRLETNDSLSEEDVLGRYSLEPGYFFYPAQFWAHKNHIRILEALVEMKSQGNIFRAVFVGGNQGNLAHIKKMLKQYALESQVRILGFVPSEHLRGLYQGCCAVLMPTYFGPTNLPPLEAWLMGKPLICSSYNSDQCGDAALLVDPDDASALGQAMAEVQQPGVSAELRMRGLERLNFFSGRRCFAEEQLKNKLIQFVKRRRCWGDLKI